MSTFLGANIRRAEGTRRRLRPAGSRARVDGRRTHETRDDVDLGQCAGRSWFHDWQSRLSVLLRSTGSRLTETAGLLREQALEQEQASLGASGSLMAGFGGLSDKPGDPDAFGDNMGDLED